MAPRGQVPSLPDVRAADARALITEFLHGKHGGGWLPAGKTADLLLRVSRLADDLPEITDLDLNPVIARPHGAFAVDARIKVAPCLPKDPFLRRLR